jgi:L-iditol 2-dehydrogenase
MRDKVLGAFGQYLCIPAPVARQSLFPRPEHLNSEQAALLEPLACVIHALEMIDWRGVDRVLVLGLGAMGLLFARLLPRYTHASLAGAGRGTVRLELARRLGLYPLADLSSVLLSEQWPVTEKFDCVIECTGKLDGWTETVARTSPGGQALLFGGLPRDAVFPADSYRIHYEEVRILGSFHFSPRDVAIAREHLMAGDLDWRGLITDCLPLDLLGEALVRLHAGVGIQYAIDPWI